MSLQTTIEIQLDGHNRERFVDECILYDYDDAKQTNAYGYEVAVDKNGRVVACAAQVTIPTGGFVLSGHGSNQDLLQNKVDIGMKIKVVDNVAYVEDHFTDRHYYKLQYWIQQIETRLNNAKTELYPIEYEHVEWVLVKMKHQLSIIETEFLPLKTLNSSQMTQLNHMMNEMESTYEEAYQYATISRRIESRGVWHRPTERSLPEIERLLDHLIYLNMNELYIETLWNGYTIYPSEIIPHHPAVQGSFGPYGNNYLLALLSEARKRNIAVHAWTENFFVGSLKNHSDLWDKHPDWRIINYNGLEHQTGKPGQEEEGFLFFDPANKEVQQFLVDFYRELTTKYQLDGLQLDYIRYPAGNVDVYHSSGYTKGAVEQFKLANNLNLTTDIREFVLEPNNYALWNRWRQQQITDFVKKVVDEVMAIRPQIVLSIAVGPEPEYARQNLLQDWQTWLENGWIDIVEPMAYVRSTKKIKSIVNQLKQIANNQAYTITGVAPTYDKLPDIYNTYFIDASREVEAFGSVIFAYHSMEHNTSVQKILKRGTHRVSATRPYDPVSVIMNTFIESIKGMALTLYIPEQVMTTKQYQRLMNRLYSCQQTVEESLNGIIQTKKQLMELKKELDLYISDRGKSYLKQNFQELITLLTIRINRYYYRLKYNDGKEELL